jgi:hypothetical protein
LQKSVKVCIIIRRTAKKPTEEGAMRNVFKCVKMSLLLCSAAAVAAPLSAAVYTLTGTVFEGKCPGYPVVNTPCTLSPVPACTVSVTYCPAVAVPVWPPLQETARTITDAGGAYKVSVDAAPNSTAIVSAFKAGAGVSSPVSVVLKAAVTNLNLFLQNVVVPPPPPKDSAALQGTVYAVSLSGSAGNRVPVPACTVIVAPLYTIMVYPVPPELKPRLLVTNGKGQYAGVFRPGDYMVSAKKAGLGSAQAKVSLVAGQTATVDLTLQSVNPPPVPPEGTANIQGTVREVVNPPDPRMGMPTSLRPVPGCTVMVCAAVLPLIAADNTAASGIDGQSSLRSGQFIAVTDINGKYFIGSIPVWGKGYSVSVMAKKGYEFGRTQVDLTPGMTVVADIIIADVRPILGGVADATAAAPEDYEQYFNQVSGTLDATGTTGVSGPAAAVKTFAAAARIEGNRLVLDMAKDQRITVKALALNGQVMSVLVNDRLFRAGTHAVPLASVPSGPVLLQIKGETGSFEIKANIMRGR